MGWENPGIKANKASSLKLVGTLLTEKPVPRFYFDVWEGGSFTRDDAGLDFGSLDAAEHEAARAAAEIGRDRLPKGNARDVRVEIRDEQRRQVVTVRVSMEVYRAASHARVKPPRNFA
jgi:hypothetical protein